MDKNFGGQNFFTNPRSFHSSPCINQLWRSKRDHSLDFIQRSNSCGCFGNRWHSSLNRLCGTDSVDKASRPSTSPHSINRFPYPAYLELCSFSPPSEPPRPQTLGSRTKPAAISYLFACEIYSLDFIQTRISASSSPLPVRQMPAHPHYQLLHHHNTC